jgi:hypothetical protein
MSKNRPPFFNPDGTFPSREWEAKYGFIVHDSRGKLVHKYVPQPLQLDFHESVATNCIMEGSRGTGKSLAIRNDAHMRALAYPGYTYLIIRRTMPELKKSQLKFIGQEMRAFWDGKDGGWHKTDNIATYPNGSQGFFSHCETEDDMMKLLSSEYSACYFDEISTFTWEMIQKIGSCVRVPEDSGLLAIVRGGTNPIGVGADQIRRYFIDKNVEPEEDPEYDPKDYENVHQTLDDNAYIDKTQYIKRLSGLPEHIRKAWLDGEWIVEGAYFHDYKPVRTVTAKDNAKTLETYTPGSTIEWHVVSSLPTVRNKRVQDMGWDEPFQWLQVYRAIDWGFSPDPAVCLWIAILPVGRAFVLKERTWKSTPARQVAADIVQDSKGMRIVDTYCDPTMFMGSKATDNTSIGDIFEDNGVPLTPSINDRAAAGFAIHEYLNTILEDGLPQLQIYGPGCPQLTRTIPQMRIHKTDPRKLADGPDHWTISLSYFCQGRIGTSREPHTVHTPLYMKPKVDAGFRLGSESVRSGGLARGLESPLERVSRW